MVGQISYSKKKLIKKNFFNKKNINLEILGFKDEISKYKKISDFSVACAQYGSGIPIKVIEILKDSKKYNYKPLLSCYCRDSLKGILSINPKYIYPDFGPIIFENLI